MNWNPFAWRRRQTSCKPETATSAPTPSEDKAPQSFPIQLMTRDQKMRYWIHGY